MKLSLLSMLIFFLTLTTSGCQNPPENPPLPAEQSASAPQMPAEPSAEEKVNSPSESVQEPEPAPAQPAATPSTASLSWYLKPNLNHETPQVAQEVSSLPKDYRLYYALPENGKTVYLTFDEGYELQYTPQILDILKEHQVQATFFITGHYLTSQPDLVKRMVAEGHQVANHTYHHPDLSTVSQERCQQEITRLADEFRDLTGTQMAPFLRPPMGKYSVSSLAWTDSLQYTTVFWSLAFHDWDPQNQPGADYSHQYVLDHIHPGAIILLHAVSESNTQALSRIIEDVRQAGYEFALLPQ